MAVYVQDIAVTALDKITALQMEANGGEFMFVLDELQDATISQTEDKVDITGKQGRKINTLKRNKAVTVSGTNGLISSNLLAVQVGSEFDTTGNPKIEWFEDVVVSSNKAELSFEPKGTVGNEIGKVYVKNSEGVVTEKLTQNASAAADKFAYAKNGTKFELTFSGLDDGTVVYVPYVREVKGASLTNLSDNYSYKCQLFIDATGEDKCGRVYHIQFYIPKADFSGQFDFSLGGDQTTHAFEAEALAGSCGTGGALWTYTIFTDEAVA